MSILARPDYKPTLTPRSDPFSNSGIIRGSAPELQHTAIRQYPITPDILPSMKETIITNQYNIHLDQMNSLIDVNKKNSKTMAKNAPSQNEYFYEKIKKSSTVNNKSMSHRFEQIDAPFLPSNQFAKVADVNHRNDQQKNTRPDLQYASAQLPKLGIENKFKDPTDPSNYMYDRTLFAGLKRRYGNTQTDFIRGDIYVAPNRFGWFDVPTNPGTDLNPGFFNLNYPSVEAHVEGQDLEVKRQNRSLTMADLESIQRNNPFSTNNLHRP